MPPWTTLLQGCLAGAYIAFGGTLIYTVGNSSQLYNDNRGVWAILIGSFGLPFALLVILMTGASLFTSNTMYLPIAWYHGKATILGWATNWGLSYVGNLGGALLICGVLKGAGMFDDVDTQKFWVLPEHKAHNAWHETLLRAILANWFVNLAIWLSTSAQDLASKFVGVYLPISSFAAIGFEHSIANMFLIPMGMMYGADISWKQAIWSNLIPATLGNIVGGWVIMATAYTLLYSNFSAARLPTNSRAACRLIWCNKSYSNRFEDLSGP